MYIFLLFPCGTSCDAFHQHGNCLTQSPILNVVFFSSLNHGQQISTNSDIYPTGMLRLSVGNGGVLKRMVSALRRPEAQGALSWQASNPVSGDVEADATMLRKFKSQGGTSFLFQFTQRLQLCVFK